MIISISSVKNIASVKVTGVLEILVNCRSNRLYEIREMCSVVFCPYLYAQSLSTTCSWYYNMHISEVPKFHMLSIQNHNLNICANSMLQTIFHANTVSMVTAINQRLQLQTQMTSPITIPDKQNFPHYEV